MSDDRPEPVKRLASIDGSLEGIALVLAILTIVQMRACYKMPDLAPTQITEPSK